MQRSDGSTSSGTGSRRDTRYRVRKDAFSVECLAPSEDASALEGSLTTISVSGLSFEIEGGSSLRPGSRLAELTVRIGRCTVRGEAIVRSVGAISPSRTELGCLFFPVSGEEDRWMALLSGVEAAQGA